MPAKNGKLWPMPVDGLFRNPRYVALPAAARGMLLSLLEQFWRTACRPLPTQDDQLFAIARAHRPTWRHHRAEILSVFKDVEPELRAYWNQRENKQTTLSFASQKRHSKERLAALLDSAHPAPTVNSIPRHAPQPAKQAQPTLTKRVMTDRR